MNTWKAITGLVILLVGIALFWNSHNQLLKCDSAGGQIATAISNFFGNNGIPACNNASIFEVVGIIAAILGVIILFLAALGKAKS
jgi:multisubunit Na+/H+ antiporter MnhG subunit